MCVCYNRAGDKKTVPVDMVWCVENSCEAKVCDVEKLWVCCEF